MNIYAINVCVDTKTTDIYDKVAVNNFPLLITCENEDKLKLRLNQEDVKLYISKLISHSLYQNAQYCIVKIHDNGKYDDSCKIRYWLKDITIVDYS